MRALVTGAAGFIGSHLCDRLLSDGHNVVAIDSFSDYYSRTLKEHNLESALSHRNFEFHELDLVEDDPSRALEDANVIFHLAGRSGLRAAGRIEFVRYLRDNVLATQRLLESVAGRSITRFVYAGSSSIYGDAEMLPTKETSIPRPLSSYGVTKLAGENLVHLYARNFGLPATCLRYFTIYGPRQRPDMAIARFIQALPDGEEVELHGDGEQTRDFTFVSDAIEATIRAATTDVVGKVLNIGGGSRTTLNAVLTVLEEISGTAARRRHSPPAPEDQRHSSASINLARQHLSWEPRVSLRDGLLRQWGWFHNRANQGRENHSTALAV